MKLLEVLPRPLALSLSGQSVRIGNLLSRLAVRHDVAVYSQARLTQLRAARSDGGDERIDTGLVRALLSELPLRTWTATPLLAGVGLRLTRPRPLRQLLGWADVVVVEYPWQFEFCRRHAQGRPVVLSLHNDEVEKFASYARAAGDPWSRHACLRHVGLLERRAFERADLVVTVSESDRDGVLERYGGAAERVVVVPNAADTSRLAPVGPARRRAARGSLRLPERPTALFIGSRKLPNRHAVRWVRALARSMGDVTFVVVGGAGAPASRDLNVVTTGPVPDIQPYLEAADVCLAPIEYGGGTKIKVIEALAAGVPVVAFEHAAEGLGLEAGRHLLVAPAELEALAGAVQRILHEPGLAASVRVAGRSHVERHLDWGHSARRLERALVALTGADAADRPAARPLAEARA